MLVNTRVSEICVSEIRAIEIHVNQGVGVGRKNKQEKINFIQHECAWACLLSTFTTRTIIF